MYETRDKAFESWLKTEEVVKYEDYLSSHNGEWAFKDTALLAFSAGWDAKEQLDAHEYINGLVSLDTQEYIRKTNNELGS